MALTAPVSVVIPCYRCEATLNRAISSVALQSLLPLEVILVNDGTGAETAKAIKVLREKYGDWVSVIDLPANVGAASARNAGWESASGQYIAFLDADDSWHPRKIELQYRLMISRPDIAVSGHGHLQVSDMPMPAQVREQTFKSLTVMQVLLKNPFVTPSFMVRRDLTLRFLPGRRHMEDHLFLMQAVTAGLGVAKTGSPLAYIFKNLFGDAGLSANLWAMQRSELENYDLLFNDNRISVVTALFFKSYSWIKFVRRILIVMFRRCRRVGSP